MKDSIVSVKSLNTKTLEVVERNNAECRFAYRSSIFKEKRGEEIVLAATFSLRSGNLEDVRKGMWEKINYRITKHPMEYPNIGSIFKNIPASEMGISVSKPEKDLLLVSVERNGVTYSIPVKMDPFHVVPAAYLISEAGLRGFRAGGAMVSDKHPNFIVNIDHATAADVKGFIQKVKNAVYERFGIRLETEV